MTKRTVRSGRWIAQSSDRNVDRGEAPSELLRELVAHLRQNRTQTPRGMGSTYLGDPVLTAMTRRKSSRSDFGVRQLRRSTRNGDFEALQAYARTSRKDYSRGVETHEVVGIVLLLRDVLARSLFAKYQTDHRLPVC